jgi:Zn-dependent peptidase ImmA (M78 family)
MTRPDDSLLQPHQLANVQRHADRLLREASAIGRFPTPVDDIMAAAKLTVVDDEVLNESLLRQFVKKAKSGMATIKSALSKVLGLFEANDRLVVIDKEAPKPRKPFIKLHEAGHGSLPHQAKVYALIHDCEKTLDAEITDLFEREANVFASEALFQGDVFAKEAEQLDFGVKAPVALARKFGSSNYAAFRRYVITSGSPCCVVVLEPAVHHLDGGFSAEVRRVVMNKSFEKIYDGKALTVTVTANHVLASVIPRKRMTFDHEIVLTDRNNDERICITEAFDTGHQTLILIKDAGVRRRSGIIVSAVSC